MHSTVCTDVEEASGDYQGFPTLSRFVNRGVWFTDVITFNNEDTQSSVWETHDLSFAIVSSVKERFKFIFDNYQKLHCYSLSLKIVIKTLISLQNWKIPI